MHEPDVLLVIGHNMCNPCRGQSCREKGMIKGICNALNKPTNIHRMIERILRRMTQPIVLKASTTDGERSGVNQIPFDGSLQEIILGGLIIAALLFDRLRHRRHR